MIKLNKLIIILAYFISALFIQAGNAYTYHDFAQNISHQYYISQPKQEAVLTDNAGKECCNIFENRNKSEITNPSNKNNGFNFGNINKTDINYIRLTFLIMFL